MRHHHHVTAEEPWPAIRHVSILHPEFDPRPFCPAAVTGWGLFQKTGEYVVQIACDTRPAGDVATRLAATPPDTRVDMALACAALIPDIPRDVATLLVQVDLVRPFAASFAAQLDLDSRDPDDRDDLDALAAADVYVMRLGPSPVTGPLLLRVPDKGPVRQLCEYARSPRLGLEFPAYD